MKNLKVTFLALMAVLGMASCSEDSDSSEQMTNYVSLAINGESALNEDDNEGVEVTVSLAYAMDNDVQVTLALSGDDKNAARLEPETVNFPAGTKVATAKVYSNQLYVLDAQEVVFVKVAGCSDSRMAPLTADGVTVTVKPSLTMENLTEEQLALIEGYKNNLGIDLTKVLGILDVTTTITYGNDDKETENNDGDTRTISGKTVITLSEQATAEKPVLKMISNPMGMESYMYEKLLRCTTEDPEGYFDENPVIAPLKEAVNYDKSRETFSVTLDGITLNADGTLDFTTAVEDTYGDEIINVPFVYDYSVWNRLNGLAQTGESVYVDEGDSSVEYTVAELIDMYDTFNPTSYLGNTDISEDYYENEPSNYIEPASMCDFTNGTMTFDFAWDYGAGMALYDYIRVHVVYTLNK